MQIVILDARTANPGDLSFADLEALGEVVVYPYSDPESVALRAQTADVVITNPTHLAIALRYDRKSMGAPRIVAKGSRLNALRIREIAKQHQIPIIENKPLARMMFKFGKVGGEIPAQLYVAVAEILAYVYRTNAYRYYREQHLHG